MSQRDRAGLEFLGSLQGYTGGVLQPAAAERYAELVPEPPQGLRERRRSVDEALADHGPWLFDRLFTRYVAEEIYVRSIPAAERARAGIEEWLDVPSDAPGSLTLDPDLDPPAYHAEGFHLTTGGWDGHDLMGVVISDLGYRYVLMPGGVGAVRAGENLMDQRTQVIREAPRRDYRRILEPGCGNGRFAVAVSDELPDAQYVGVELSRTQLEYARARCVHEGRSWELIQAAAEDTRLPDASVDLVAIFTLFHETPPKATEAILAEMFRVLEPGGDLVIGDIAPVERNGAFRSAVLDWETEHRGEPFMRSYLRLDMPSLVERAGFTDVKAYGLGKGDYPWIVRAHKEDQ
ncbi:class I SAM-dependent methyltransferase [Actinomadura algeriensis]|uniref:Ubiquinone/menaquinone biosynthesis C-methylase UbiE n=1 Tax=Actinomadura algeriensis TaxID=1679523 RepID=A0ABR9K2K4_9ACTN|nr:class I SAM-dependent methyltransferase [Actinomadura algeriensis]MBE1536565.1 ubiquinone/menaquinone biosynthesis C-methylase UbiE [Actinomadura algeriensis]